MFALIERIWTWLLGTLKYIALPDKNYQNAGKARPRTKGVGAEE